MGCKALDVKVISAKHLSSVNRFSKMNVYVVVSISGDSQKQEFKTPVDHDAGSNPTWDFPMKFTVDDQNRQSIVFNIKSKRFLGDKDIGEVIVPVKELVDRPGDGKSPQFLSYQVKTPKGKLKGQLHFSYKFGDVDPAAAANFNEPVTAYPVSGSSFAPYAAGTPYPPPPAGYPPSKEQAAYAYPPPPQNGGYPSPPQHPGYGAYPAQGGYGYPPSQEHAAYAYPPPQGYGYPPPPQHPGYGAYPAQGGYGYPPVLQQQQQQQQAPKNKLGMGFGAGLLGGKLAGLLIGDMLSDNMGSDMDMGDFDF